MMSASPPPNKPAKQLLKVAADRFQRRQEQLPAVDVDPLDDSLQRCLRVDQVAILVGKLFESGFELLQFVERLEIDRADVVDLVAKLGDFPLDASRSKVASPEQ